MNLELRRYLEKVGRDLNAMSFDAELKLVNRQGSLCQQRQYVSTESPACIRAAADKMEIPGYLQVTLQIMSQPEANSKKAS